MTAWRLMDGANGRPGTGSTGTQPPSTALAFTGNYTAGLVFNVTQVVYIDSFWWWVPNTNGVTTAQKFALWQATSSTGGVLVSAATVTSGALTAGAWNQVMLPAPLALTPFFPYVAASGFASVSPRGFPDTQNQFGVSQPYSGGFSNGPLVCAANGASTSFNLPQSPFSTAGADPAATFPHTNDLNDLLWLDVQVTDQVPANTTYRGFPNSPGGFGGGAQNLAYTLGVEFHVTSPCKLLKIWHYSPATATILPSRCGLWTVASQTELAGSDNSSPAWKNSSGASASPGDGWIYCDYSAANVQLAANVNYKVSTFTSDNTDVWFAASANFWGGGGLWSGGITNGPLVIPGNAAATAPGQDSWNQGTVWTYPNTSTNPEFDGVDVEVQLVSSTGTPLLMATWP